MKHVISTLAASTKYTGWVHTAGINTIERIVEVRGGAGVALLSAGQIVGAGTPSGVRTEISDDDAAWLMQHKQFQDHLKRGFVRIVDKPVDPEVASKTMSDDDASRPKTEQDVKKDAADTAAKAGLTPDETLQVATNGKKK